MEVLSSICPQIMKPKLAIKSLRASDGRGGIDDANFTIDVNEQSEAPEFFAGPSSM